MGYYVYTVDSNLFLDKKHFESVYEKMCKLNDFDELKRGGMFGSNNDPVPGEKYNRNSWFSWMPHDYPETMKDMQTILIELGFDLEFDGDGNLINLSYANKVGNEDYFLNCFAGFINDGSYITFKGEEDEDLFRYSFTKGKMIMQRALIKYEWPEGEEYTFGELSEDDKRTKEWLKTYRKEQAEAQ
jgi:hypothetical protein